MKKAKLLLEKATELFPPTGEMAHSLTLTDGGNLLLTLMQEGNYRGFAFEEEDLDRPIGDLLLEIKKLVRDAV